MERNRLISNTQHGFRHGRSTQTNLIEFFNNATKWLDDGKCFDVVYLDFAKAFDKVCHERLLAKLENIGVTGKMLKWFEGWLSERKQRVVVEGHFSKWIDVISSVMQGSVLGAILFNIFIDDIDQAALLALIQKFADDTKLGMLVNSEADAEQMQAVIDELHRWAERWAMAFNEGKCKIMHFGRDNIRHKYFMNGTQLEEVEEEKDLGVWVETSMKPNKQCDTAAKKANFVLGMIIRSFHYRKSTTLVPLYKTFVRPLLEYAVAAWCPWHEKDIQKLEKVQERFIRQLSNKKGDTYEERLENVGLTTLRTRRKRGDLIETFKCMKGHLNVDKHSWFEIKTSETTRSTRSTSSVSEEGQTQLKSDVINLGHTRLECRRNFFTNRVIKDWNKLPDEIKDQKTVNAFKSRLDVWLKLNNYK